MTPRLPRRVSGNFAGELPDDENPRPRPRIPPPPQIRPETFFPTGPDEASDNQFQISHRPIYDSNLIEEPTAPESTSDAFFSKTRDTLHVPDLTDIDTVTITQPLEGEPTLRVGVLPLDIRSGHMIALVQVGG